MRRATPVSIPNPSSGVRPKVKPRISEGASKQALSDAGSNLAPLVTLVGLGAGPSIDPQPSAQGPAPNPIRRIISFLLELLDPGSHEVSM